MTDYHCDFCGETITQPYKYYDDDDRLQFCSEKCIDDHRHYSGRDEA